jgi:hypothetical protein
MGLGQTGGDRRPNTNDTTNMTINTTKNIHAISEATYSVPESPKTPAINAITKKSKDSPNMGETPVCEKGGSKLLG